MSIRSITIPIVVILALARLAGAQTATIVIDDAMTSFLLPPGMFTNAPRLTSTPDAERLIRATLQSSGWFGDTIARDLGSRKLYVVIHVLKWADPSSDAGSRTTQTVQEQNWYVFRGGSGWTLTDFASAKRLYGTHGFYLLTVHLNHAPEAGAYRVNYVVTIVKKQAANVANLIAAAKLLGANFDAIRAQTTGLPRENLWAGRFVHVNDVPSDISIAPAIVATGGIQPAPSSPAAPGAVAPPAGTFGPIPVAAGGGAAAGAGAAGAGGTAGVGGGTAAPAGAGGAAAVPNPLDQKIAELTKQVEELKKQAAAEPQSLGDTQKFDNEGKYWWDVSVGVPVRKVSDFARTGTGLDVKTVTKSTAFALLNIYVKPVDVKTPALNNLPHVLFGVGMEKRPLDRIFIGGGWGPVYANFFAGVAFKRLAQDGKTTYPHEVTFGLNVPILSVTKRLSEQSK